MTTYLLIVPPQPQYRVPEHRSYCCYACGHSFVSKAGIGQLVPAGQHFDCELRYTGVCEQAPAAA